MSVHFTLDLPLQYYHVYFSFVLTQPDSLPRLTYQNLSYLTDEKLDPVIDLWKKKQKQLLMIIEQFVSVKSRISSE